MPVLAAPQCGLDEIDTRRSAQGRRTKEHPWVGWEHLADLRRPVITRDTRLTGHQPRACSRLAGGRRPRDSSDNHPRLKRPLIRPTRARGGLLRAREADGALVLGGSGPDTGVIPSCFISRLDLRMEKVSAYRPPVSRIEKGSVESTHKGVPTEPRVLHVPFPTTTTALGGPASSSVETLKYLNKRNRLLQLRVVCLLASMLA